MSGTGRTGEFTAGVEPAVLVTWASGSARNVADHLIRSVGLPAFGVAGDRVQVVNHCRECGSTGHGRLVLTGVPGDVTFHVNASYCPDVTLVAVTPAGAVGVDVERMDALSYYSVLDDVVQHPRERPTDDRSMALLWVRKESLLKATGRGLTVDPRQVQVATSEQCPELLSWEADEPPDAPVWMFDVDVSPDHVASVTVLAAERPHLVVRRAAEAASAHPATR